MRVVILGGTGMLGVMVSSFFNKSEEKDLEIRLLSRRHSPIRVYAETATTQQLVYALDGCEWAINCIGLIKPYIKDEVFADVKMAIEVNARFPHVLTEAAEITNTRVIQIATDCVWKGEKGNYLESDPQDALDVYGKTKSLGEAHSRNMHHLRCSIIGPEKYHHASLFEWFKSSQGPLNGYTTHTWNGITTLQFAKICHGIITSNMRLGHMQHVVPADTVNKHELLTLFKSATGKDVEIIPSQPSPYIDRTLGTENLELNNRLWRAAGYSKPPMIAEMVGEMVGYEL